MIIGRELLLRETFSTGRFTSCPGTDFAPFSQGKSLGYNALGQLCLRLCRVWDNNLKKKQKSLFLT